MESQNRRRALRGASALVAGALLALGFASAASADGDPNLGPSSITQTTGSLTVHKYEKPAEASGIAADGSEITDSDDLAKLGTPLSGAEFSVYQLPYDLTTNAGWLSLSALKGDADAAWAALGASPTATKVQTTVNGATQFADLPVGAYLVKETKTPNGYTPVAPFVVTIPITNPANKTAWLYDVHVYPKDAKLDIPTKTVVDKDAKQTGDSVVWTILGDIPQPLSSDGKTVLPLDGYGVKDILDARLKYSSLTLTTTNAPDVPFVDGVDYDLVVTPDDKSDTDTTTSQTVLVKLRDPGLRKLEQAKDADPTAKVQVVITTKVTGNGEISNEAIVYPNEGSFSHEPGEEGGPIPTDPEHPTITKFGNVTILKKDTSTPAKPINGAEFAIYGDLNGAPNTAAGPLATGSTGEDGTLTFSGLHQSGWYNGAAVDNTNANYRYYWVVETKAAPGYELLAQPVRVTVGDADSTVDFEITDADANGGFDLPFTGSALGAGLFYGGGAAILLAIAVTYIVRQRRKNNATV